jgi:5-methylcytosine-specific restriction endonuclease McrA
VKRSGFGGRRSPLRAQSARRRRQNEERRVNLAHVRETQTWCSMCGATGVGLDAHELVRRSQGGSITDLENIVLLCRPDHQWVTEHPREAAEQGWAFSKKYPPS